MELTPVKCFFGILLAAIAVLFVARMVPSGSQPTCLTLEFSEESNSSHAPDLLISSYMGASKLVQTESSQTNSRRAFNERLFIRWEGKFKDSKTLKYSIMVCSQDRQVSSEWRRSILDLERLVNARYRIDTATLQRGTAYSCDRSCEFYPCKNPCNVILETPLDFGSIDKLLRT